MRRACSLSDLNNLANSSSNPGATAPRRKRSFHRHRNGFYLVLLHYSFLRTQSKEIFGVIYFCDLVHVYFSVIWFIVTDYSFGFL